MTPTPPSQPGAAAGSTPPIDPGMQPRLDVSVLGVVAVLATLISGRIATSPHLAWYATLAKPSFNPPNWLFGPAWALLYLLMAFAIWRVMQRPASPARRLAATLFFIQLALNAAWSWMFFGAQSPVLGLVNIIPQFLAVVATFVAVLRVDRYAGWAIAPLVLWVGFATLLNAAVWSLNG